MVQVTKFLLKRSPGISLAVLGSVLTLVLAAQESLASQARPAAGVAVPCAIVERFGGNIQLLSPERNRVREAELKASVECGGWVSVVDGWVHLRHRSGALVGLTSGGLARVEEPARPGGEALQLVQGEAFVQALANSGEFRVLTSNARARVLRGRAVVLYRDQEQDSQVLVLSGQTLFENRFQAGRQVSVRSGEFSSLNFKLMRTTPLAPAAFAQATLREKTVALHLDEATAEDSLERLRLRQNRIFASKTMQEAVHAAGPVATRSPASAPGDAVVQPEKAGKPSPTEKRAQTKAQGSFVQYERHTPSPDDPALLSKLKRSIAGGESVADEILHPEHFTPEVKKSKVVIRELEKGGRPADEESERARLLDELSRLKPGD